MADYTLRFDDYRLSLLDSGSVVKSWDAVSGNAGYQSPAYQGMSSTGPIPEGNWSFSAQPYSSSNPNGVQTITVQDDVIGTVGAGYNALTGDKVGAWPGGTWSWGLERAFLQPAEGTDTLGRSDFSIHGGDFYGSAGCIDLGHNEVDFFQTLSDRGIGNITVEVKYDPALFDSAHPLAGQMAGVWAGPFARGPTPTDHLGNPIGTLNDRTWDRINNFFQSIVGGAKADELRANDPLDRSEPDGSVFQSVQPMGDPLDRSEPDGSVFQSVQPMGDPLDRFEPDGSVFQSVPPMGDPLDRFEPDGSVFQSAPPMGDPLDRFEPDGSVFQSVPPMGDPLDRFEPDGSVFQSVPPMGDPLDRFE